MTVKDLRVALAGLPADTTVVIGTERSAPHGKPHAPGRRQRARAGPRMTKLERIATRVYAVCLGIVVAAACVAVTVATIGLVL